MKTIQKEKIKIQYKEKSNVIIIEMDFKEGEDIIERLDKLNEKYSIPEYIYENILSSISRIINEEMESKETKLIENFLLFDRKEGKEKIENMESLSDKFLHIFNSNNENRIHLMKVFITFF
jgi:hypothetical protein